MESKIKSMSIITNEIYFHNNCLKNDFYHAMPNLIKKTGKLGNGENKYGVELIVEFKDSPENRFPVDLKVDIMGIFEIEGDNENEIKEFLNTQGVQMVYPYLRALVSNISSNAFIPQINLPIINILDFKEMNL